MSKIKIFSLGGLNEMGKNTYIIDINEEIYIFDCGLKYASENLYGIDYILPDYEFLIKNRKRIKGLFLTHAHNENIGGVYDLVRSIPELRVFATKFTKFQLLEDGVPEKNIVEIVAHKKIVFKNVSIFPISVSHSTPEAVMYVINTDDGAIAYTGDFIIDPSMVGHYSMDLGKIAYVGKQGVLALLSESQFAEKKDYTSPKHRLTSAFKDIINHNQQRILFCVLPNQLYTIQNIFDAASNTHRKIVIMGKKLQKIISMSKQEKYLSFADDALGDLSNLKDPNVILLIGDDRTKQYSIVEKIVNGYVKFININKTDTFVFAEPKYDSYEKTLVNLQDDIAIIGANTITFSKDKVLSLHASCEDLMLMIKLINPKYYIPVKGDYRYMCNNADIASTLGIPNENILLKQNGDVITFIDGKLVEETEHININDVLMDGKSDDDVGEVVIKDRQVLSENGIVLITTTLAKRDKKIICGPEVTTRGFIYVRDSAEMIDEIKKICKEVIESNVVNNYIDYNKVKQEIREVLGKYLYQETECKPMIIAVMQEL